jgi:hypothetical protein
MMADVPGWRKKRRRLWLALALMVVLLGCVVVPPLVGISRYKSRITQLISASLGRPVRMSSVELRLIPVPGFVLTDLTVDEDPGFGAEPILRANTVTASIRLLSLWRGRLEISTISVDEASLNVVRTAEGRWNLDPLFRTAAAKVKPAGPGTGPDGAGLGKPKRVIPLPYLEATHSRINFKQGVEKLPFSLVDTELSFWQENPGDWRLRLRGQPARTDLSLDLADTGQVRLEARAQSAPELEKMPLHLDMEWREAQLGQLTRLLIGSDPGWRGDLTGELHLDGTADAAQIQTRLRATGVHRAEFAPAAPMDFDATCSFLFHSPTRAMENLACDSPLGDGRIRLTGDLPGNGISPRLSVELDRIPVAAGLDALRTVRSDFGPGMEVKGLVSGKISYDATILAEQPPDRHGAKNSSKARSARIHPVPAGPLKGSFTVEGFELSGDGLSTPIEAAKLILEPLVSPQGPVQGKIQVQGSSRLPAVFEPVGLEAKVPISAGGPAPLVVTARLALAGYQVTVRGQALIARARELAHVAGMADASALEALAGEPLSLDLAADGPWLPTLKSPFAAIAPASAIDPPLDAATGPRIGPEPAAPASADNLSGTVTLHNANWKADYLANHVEITQAVLHLGDGEYTWDPVVFSYGPIKGTATVNTPARCSEKQHCASKFQLHFDELDAGALQAALLGAHDPGTLLSTLLSRLGTSSSTKSPAWPSLEGTVNADSLILGPVTLADASADLRIADDGAKITNLDADLLGGHVSGAGTMRAAGAANAKPSYTLEGHFEKLSPPAVGKLLGQDWSGRSIDADGTFDLSGFTGTDLAASVNGTLHFDWSHGSVGLPEDTSDSPVTVPPALAHFDKWTGDAEFANGKADLKDSQAQQGARKRDVDGALTLGDPPRLIFGPSKELQAKR